MEKNTPQLWDKQWKVPSSLEEDLYQLRKEESTIRWQRIEKMTIRKWFGIFICNQVQTNHKN